MQSHVRHDRDSAERIFDAPQIALLVGLSMDSPVAASGLATRPITLFGIAMTGILGSRCLGGMANAVNGWVSPEYFVNIMHWQEISDIWRASIAQGVLEGLGFGVFFSLVFAGGAGIMTGAACRYGFACRHLLGVFAGALVCWATGGLAAIGLASLSPEFYRQAFREVPETFGPMLAYAWVGGSIWGLQLGGLISVVLGLVVLRANWRRELRKV